MGYLLAGYDVIGNIECDPKVNAVYQANLHPEYSYTEDIRDFTVDAGLPGELYDLDILDGSPPCTPFTILRKDRDKTWGKEVYHIEGGKKQRLDDFFSGLSSLPRG